MNEDRPALTATELLRTDSTFQRCIDYVDIGGRFSARSLQSKYSERKWRFSTLIYASEFYVSYTSRLPRAYLCIS